MTQLILPGPLFLIGCGNMAGAMLEGWLAAGADPRLITVVRPSGRPPAPGIRTLTALPEDEVPAVVLLGVKPQKLAEVAPVVAPALEAETILVSILAGVELASLRERFPGVRTIVRAIPNLPVAVRRGVVGLIGENEDEAVKREVADLFQPLGYAPWMVDEQKFAAVGAVAGAGPAYVARFIAALSKAGEGQGLSPEMSATIALETVFGTAWMAASAGASMEEIARRVASPKGTTEAGLQVLDRDGVLNDLVALAIAAAERREKQLAKAAKSASLAER